MARFNVGDRVTWDRDEYTVALPEPDCVGDIILMDGRGEYEFASERDCTPVPPPDPRDAVVAAAVAWLESRRRADLMTQESAALRDAVQAWKAAQ